MNRRPRGLDLPAPVPGLRHLFEGERNENAEHDNSDFAGKFAPAAQRLGYMDMHSGRWSFVGYGSVTDDRMSAMAGEVTSPRNSMNKIPPTGVSRPRQQGVS